MKRTRQGELFDLTDDRVPRKTVKRKRVGRAKSRHWKIFTSYAAPQRATSDGVRAAHAPGALGRRDAHGRGALRERRR